MSQPNSITSSVEVALDPGAAFDVFTEEVDCWWVQGPINFHDSSRAWGHKIEPGVGGRVMEVYDEESGDGLELARITVWEPGTRLCWKSSIDEVEIDVRFEKTAAGTVVKLEATVPKGGDKGGTAWVRMTPPWLSRWVAKRDRVPHEPRSMARVAVGIDYVNPNAAARFLRDVFGLEPSDDLKEHDSLVAEQTWIEFHIGDSSVFVFGREADAAGQAPGSHTTWIFVDDLDAHFERSKRAGAKILREIWQQGPRAYDVADLEGNRWTFAQRSPRMH